MEASERDLEGEKNREKERKKIRIIENFFEEKKEKLRVTGREKRVKARKFLEKRGKRRQCYIFSIYL